MTTGAQGTLERMIGEGTPFEDIEQYIETLALPSEQLGALWLLAWAEATDPLTRRRVVAEALTVFEGLPESSLAVAPRRVPLTTSVVSYLCGAFVRIPIAGARALGGEERAKAGPNGPATDLRVRVREPWGLMRKLAKQGRR